MRNNRVKTVRIAALMLSIFSLPIGCSSGGGSAGGGGQGSPGHTALVGGIRAASDSTRGQTVENILAVGDRYEMVTDPGEQQALLAEIWQKLTSKASWVAPSNPLFTYQFYEDANLGPGPRFRYTGFAVETGGVVFKTVGRYWAADNRGPFLAVSLHTWDYNPEFLVVASDTEMAHAIEHFNGMPTATAYRGEVR